MSINDPIRTNATIAKALQLLARQHPTMTLESANLATTRLIFEAHASSQIESTVDDCARRALHSEAVQALLPPWEG